MFQTCVAHCATILVLPFREVGGSPVLEEKKYLRFAGLLRNFATSTYYDSIVLNSLLQLALCKLNRRITREY